MIFSRDSELRKLNPFSASAKLDEQANQGYLSESDRVSIRRRLTTNMLGAGLLAIGLLAEWMVPSQTEVSQIVQAIAALIVSTGVLGRAIRGFFSSPATNHTEQLVALAVLAAIAAGDFVSAALVPLLLEIGHLFEERSALGAQAAIDRIRSLCSRNATLIVDGKEKSVASEELRRGDKVIVRPGETIPADGRVRVGHACIDQSPVTGESDPKEVCPGDKVFNGTVNVDGLLEIEVVDVGDDTVLGEVVRVLHEVENTKIPVVRMLEKAAAVYLPLVIILAAAVLVIGGELSRFITVLVVACPCALVLAAPAAMVSAMGAATKKSVLIKNAEFLEAVASVDTLILDKTGTITEGKQSLDFIKCFGNHTQDEVLLLAATAAHGSRHPASKAITSEALERDLQYPKNLACREFSGRGVETSVGSHVVRIGRASWLSECGVNGLSDTASAGVWVSKDEEPVGFISLIDQPRGETMAAIKQMRALNFSRIILLTGDKLAAAEGVAKQLQLDEVFAEVLPSEKLEVVRREQRHGRSVLMVGDGVNDALALSAADVGFAIGTEMNDVALGGADVAILSNNVNRIPFVVQLADLTHRVIIENVFISLVFSFGMLGLAAVGAINPLTGALFHNVGAILVVLNSTRLIDNEEKPGPVETPIQLPRPSEVEEK